MRFIVNPISSAFKKVHGRIAAALPRPAPSHVSTASAVPALKPDPASITWCDWSFLALFALAVGSLVHLLIQWSLPVVNDAASDSFAMSRFLGVLGITGSIALVSTMLGFIALLFMIRHPAWTMKFIFISSLFLCLGCLSVVATSIYSLGLLFVVGVFVLVLSVGVCISWRRIPLAAANVRVARIALWHTPSVIALTFGITMVQIAWMFLWTIALLGLWIALLGPTGSRLEGQSCEMHADCQSRHCASISTGVHACSTPPILAYVGLSFYLVLILFWVVQVLKGILHVSIAGAMGAFWYGKDSGIALFASLCRGCTVSLGSICYGAFLAAIIQLIEVAISFMSCLDPGIDDRPNSCCCCVSDSTTTQNSAPGCFQSVVHARNRWAFVYVAFHGHGYVQANRSVKQLFLARGFAPIMSDSLAAKVLVFCALDIGVICLGLGTRMGAEAFQSNYGAFVGSIIGLVVGGLLAVTPMVVMDSIVTTMVICFAEDPSKFEQSQPALFNQLMKIWFKVDANMLTSAGYCTTS